MDHVVEASKEPPGVRRSRARPVLSIVLCTLLLAASAYSWIERPEHIWGPSGQAPSPVVERANARLMLVILAQRLEAVRARTGHYPLSLAEAGETVGGISYEVVGDTGFVLMARSAADTIVLRAHEDPNEFLGKTVELISGRSR